MSSLDGNQRVTKEYEFHNCLISIIGDEND
jgi:hypothetical protein